MAVANILWIALGGALGAVGRWAVGELIRGELPWATFLVNVLGSLVIGFVFVLEAAGPNPHVGVRLFLTVGFCGAFTTFSTFSYQTLALLMEGRAAVGLLNIFLSVTVCLAAVWLGMFLATLLVNR